jgi:hypothetical protein
MSERAAVEHHGIWAGFGALQTVVKREAEDALCAVIRQLERVLAERDRLADPAAVESGQRGCGSRRGAVGQRPASLGVGERVVDDLPGLRHLIGEHQHERENVHGLADHRQERAGDRRSCVIDRGHAVLSQSDQLCCQIGVLRTL